MRKVKKSKRKEFLKVCKIFFDENGLDLTVENGNKLPKDTELKGYKKEWSEDVFVLTEYGVTTAYFRPEEKDFTVENSGFFDLFPKDCPMLSNKFVSIKKLNSFLKLKENVHLFL